MDGWELCGDILFPNVGKSGPPNLPFLGGGVIPPYDEPELLESTTDLLSIPWAGPLLDTSL